MGVGVAGVRGRGSVTPDLLLLSPPTVECGVCCHPSSIDTFATNHSLTHSHTFTNGKPHINIIIE